MGLALPGVSLCCVDTRYPGLAEDSLARSVLGAGIEFGEVVLFTGRGMGGFARRHDFPLRIEEVDTIGSRQEYSEFVLRVLPTRLACGHALITQWDSWVLDAGAWDDRFLQCDYIGAVWNWFSDPWRVGNGGFCLRSARLMREAARRIGPVPPGGGIESNEDVLICRVHRAGLEQAGMRFADEALARRFSFERDPPQGPVFGFHGLFNVDRVLPPGELESFLGALPAPLALGIEGAEIAVQVYNAGRQALGRSLVQRRLQALPGDAIGRDLARQMWGPGEPCWCGSALAFGRCHGGDGQGG